MLKKLVLLLISILLLSSCSKHYNTLEKELEIDETYTAVQLVKSDIATLLSIQYRIINHTEENTDPFYINLVFHNNILEDYFGIKEYSSYKKIGGKEIILTKGATYQGGDNLDAIVDQIDELKLMDAVANHNSIEIQIIDQKTEGVIRSQWIHKIAHVDASET